MHVSISLTPELLSLVKEKVASGRYSSTSEVVRAALRLLERVERPESDYGAALRRAWQEGVGSGDAGALDLAELRQAAIKEKASPRKARRRGGAP